MVAKRDEVDCGLSGWIHFKSMSMRHVARHFIANECPRTTSRRVCWGLNRLLVCVMVKVDRREIGEERETTTEAVHEKRTKDTDNFLSR
jgi:hypothetical protein